VKNLFVLLLIVIFQVTGNAFLSHGMRLVGEVNSMSPVALFAMGTRALTNPWVVVGVILLLGYLLSFLVALSRLELSYVLPMTAFGYVLNAFVAWGFLGEVVSVNRWVGTGVICIGMALVGLSEYRKTRSGIV